MPNPKYLCYMISVLQCLFSVQQIVFYLYKKLYIDSPQDNKKKPLHNLLYKMVKDIMDAEDCSVDLKELSIYFESKFSLY